MAALFPCLCEAGSSYSFSGVVQTSMGDGVAGVTVVFSLVGGQGDLPGPVTTDGAGRFSQSGFSEGAEYSAEPRKAGWLFGPPRIEFSAGTENAIFIGRPPFSIFGRVTDGRGVGVPGVTLTFSLLSRAGAVPGAVTTNANGEFSQEGFTNGAEYRVTPEKDDLRFSPVGRDFSVETASSALTFVLAAPYTLSGRVVDTAGKGVAGVEVSFLCMTGDGELPAAVFSDEVGFWTQSGFSYGFGYVVSAKKAGYAFDPSYREASGAADDLDFTAAPPYSVSGRVADKLGRGIEGVEVGFRLKRLAEEERWGCVASYDFEGTCEDSVGQNHGVGVDIGYVESKPGHSRAIYFCKDRSVVNIGDGPNISNLSAFTLTAWVLPLSDGDADAGKIYFKHSSAGGSIVFEVCFESAGSVRLFGRVGCEQSVAESLSQTRMSLGEWHHVAMTWDSSSKFVCLYIDGTEVLYGYRLQGVGEQPEDSGGSGCIGSTQVAGRRFDGYIDSFRIYRRVLTPTELMELGKEEQVVPGTVITAKDGTWSQTGFWGGCWYEAVPSKEGWGFEPTSLRFGEAKTNLNFTATPPYAVSGKVSDPSGRGVAGVEMAFTRTGPGTADLDGCIAAYEFEGSLEDRVGDNEGTGVGIEYAESTRSGGLAANFSGNGGAVNIGSASVLDNLATFTVGAWICPRSDGEGDAGKIFWKYNPAGGSIRFGVSFEGATGVRLGARVLCASVHAESLSLTTVPVNEWRHVAMTWNNATKLVRLFVNGAEVTYGYMTRGVGAQNDDAAGEAIIGNIKGGGRRFDGYIDEMRIFNRALSAEEIRRVMGHDESARAVPSVTTGSDGAWSQAGFAGGRGYLVTPSKAGWGFTPHRREFGAAAGDVDFVAAPPYAVSGRVTDAAGKGIEGAVLRFSSRKPGPGVPLPVVTDREGNYVQGGFWGLCEYGVVPSKTGWGFDPALRQFSGAAYDVNFVGSEPYRASGRVVDTSGNPVAGVRISFSNPDGSRLVPEAVTTDGNGYWSQTGFRGGVSYRASPSKEGWAFDPAGRLFVEEATGLDFLALPPFSAEGRITDPAGNGVAGVAVTFVAEKGGWVPPAVVTDALGRWHQDGFAPGNVYKAVPSKQSWVFAPAFREFAEEATNQDFLGTPPYGVTGKAIDESGHGVGGVTVRFWVRSGAGFVPSQVVTNDSGSWSQSGFSVGTEYAAGFAKEGWVFTPSWLGFSGPGGELVVVGGGPYPVSGKAADGSGKGLAGIKIVFSPRGEVRRTPASVVTAADGTWSQGGFARGSTYWAIPSDGGARFSPSYRVFSGPASGLDFVAGEAYGVSGRVLDEEGHPVPGVEIVFTRRSRSGTVPPPAATGQDGAFSQTGFSSGGAYRVTPRKVGWGFTPGYADFSGPAEALAFTGQSPYAVSGRIAKSSGEGVGGVEVIFAADDPSAYTPLPATTASDGTFRQSGLWGGKGYKAIPKKERWSFTPGMRQFSGATSVLDFAASEPQVALTVLSDYGTPAPPRGTQNLALGATVNAAVDAVVLEGIGTKHTCLGWHGTGAVPATGTEPSLTFVIVQDSSLTWLWRTEYRLEASALPPELGTVEVSGGEWYEAGSKATISAKAKEGYTFTGWSGDATGRAPAVSLVMDQPRSIVAHFSDDSDGDGLPDEWEMRYFGDLSEDGFGDPDADDAPNSVEYVFDTNPAQPTPKLNVVMSECGTNAAIEFPTIKNRVSVLDQEGNSVEGLTAADFVIWEDRVRQLPLEVAESGGEDVVSVALVLDNSGSMAGQPLGDSHNAASIFIDQLKPRDSAAIIKFGTTVSLVQQFTSDKDALHAAVEKEFGGAGDTAFYSAVYRALHESIVEGGSRAVVALTDGVDNASSHGLQQVVEYARRTGVPVFVVGLGSVAEEPLRSLAEGTGGRYYYAPDSSGLQGIYDEISRIAGNWYQADYVTSNSDPNAPPYPRKVTVWAHSNSAIGRDDGEYKPPRENTSPLCHVDTPQGEQQGDVPITFQLMDFESDVCFVEVFYSRDGGWSWERATLSAESSVTGLSSSPEGVSHGVIWLSAGDMPGVDEDHVQVKVVPFDPKKGEAGETAEFAVRNNARPQVEVETPLGQQGGEVAIAYRLADKESDVCSVIVEYSLAGAQWNPAMEGAGGDGWEGLASSPEGQPHLFVWDSLHDVGYGGSDDVVIKVTPSDKKTGRPDQTDNFSVNNVPPERLSYSPEFISFVASEGGENPAAKVLEIWNSGGRTLTWRLESGAPWLSLSPGSGESAGEKDEVKIQVSVLALRAGIYSAEIRIESSDVLSGSSTVHVTLTVEEPPGFIVVSPDRLAFTAVLSEGDPQPQPLYVRNGARGDMAWEAWVSAAWLSVTPNRGSSAGETDALLVSPQLVGLIPGTYKATITIVAPKASNTPRMVPVTLTVAKSRPQIAVEPEKLVFSADEGRGDPPPQVTEIWNAGGLALSWQATTGQPWIDVSPNSGISTGEKDAVSVSVWTAGMPAGMYEGSITIAAEGAMNSPVSVPVQLQIKPSAEIVVSPSQLIFRTGRGGPNPPPQQITISSSGALEWIVTADAGWVSVNPSNGVAASGSCTVTVSVQKSGLDLGTYYGKITVRAVGSSAEEKTVSVTLRVGPLEVPTDYPTIQGAVDAAYDDDTVLVAPGTYRENISISTNVEVRSSDGSDSTTIDGTGLGTVVAFENVQSARLEGFTIVNGTGSNFARSAPVGGGIYCAESSPVISQCQIVGNAAAWGGGLCVDRGSSPRVVDSIIIGNMADDGGGVFCYEGTSPTFVTTVIGENYAYWYGGGACAIGNSNPTFSGCLFYENSADFGGGGIYAAQGCNLQVMSCTLADNSSVEGANILTEPGATAEVVNSLIWGDAGDLVLLGGGTVEYSNVTNLDLLGIAGNIVAEPVFFDPDNGDYHLLPNSPCIDKGLNDVQGLPEKDLDGDPRVMQVYTQPITDMGADEHDPEMIFIRTTGQIHVAPDGTVSVPYALWNARSVSCPIVAEYSDDGGKTWKPATLAATGELPTGVVSSPSGKPHTFVWDSRADIGNGTDQQLSLRLKVEAPKASRPAVVGPFVVPSGQ